ncbi:MAG TPA: hypothetical protein VEZ11_03465, partial [Thermoanaerobaculia bacterium]|nr:hypothetical protein [Thermoanaerobaculia bacterium]
AGGGTEDGQLATDIHTFGPRGIALDQAGNVYFSERYAGRVRKVGIDGRIVTIAGTGAAGFGGDGGPAPEATLNQPLGLAVAADGAVYVADHENGRIRRVDPKSGIITTFAGGGAPPENQIGDGGPATAAVLHGPRGLTISRGFLYVTEDDYNGNRVRKVSLTSGTITTVAGPVDGTSGFDGDGGQALAAHLDGPSAIVADANGNLFVADTNNSRARRIDPNGVITTYAGGGDPPDGIGDNGPATGASLPFLTTLAFDLSGNLLVSSAPRIRKIDRATQVISTIIDTTGLLFGMVVDSHGNILVSDDSTGTVRKYAPGDPDGVTFAGGGSYIGDGLTATSGVLHLALGVAIDPGGNLYIADTGDTVIRKIDAATGKIGTAAGRVGFAYANDPQEGTPALASVVGEPWDVALDSAGNLYVADILNGRVWRVDGAAKIATFAGGGSPADGVGDGGPATAAAITPWALAFDAADNLFIADHDANRVRRVDAKTKIITTVAGNGKPGAGGNQGPATAATLAGPVSVAVDKTGNLFIGDSSFYPAAGDAVFDYTIRRVDARTQIITVYAGGGNPPDGVGDNGPATSAGLVATRLAVDPVSGDLLLLDQFAQRVRRIDPKSGIITTYAGSGFTTSDGGFSGDNGPAIAAKINLGFDVGGLAVSTRGDVFIGDSDNNRVRAVFACRSVDPLLLLSPADGATGVATAPALAWSDAGGAFRYDVLLDTVSPPLRVAAADVSETSYAPSNLQPATKYFWSVTAKGDPFCSPNHSTASRTGSFTTSGRCGAAPFDLVSPADGAAQIASPLQLSWQSSAGAASYDLYLGPVNPPPLAASGLQTTTFTSNATGTNYWFVVAHAACDGTKTASTAIRSFNAAGPACTPGQISVTLSSPANGATGVATALDLTWSATGTATTFDLYLGTAQSPPLFNASLAATHQTVSGLIPGTTYFWRVVAKGACDPNGVSSATGTFATRTCAAPSVTSILFAPAAVSTGATYSIVWAPAAGLDPDGGYLVERSTSSTFATVADSQVTASTAASFVAPSPGTWYHRVRAVPGCDPTKSGPPSDPKAVNVTSAQPNVIFTVQPNAAITSLGERLEGRVSTFTLENIGTDALQVIVGRQELGGSPPFFSIVDPQGSDVAFVTLAPRVPRTFEVHYSGPPNNSSGSYQGVIFVAATGSGLTVTPYAFVNLKVGGGAAAAPQFTAGGVATDYVAFPGLAGDDTGRAPLAVTIRNNGSTPMELGAEIGPEVWLVPESGWNSTPLAPGASRTVNLLTRRNLAPNGSPLPRYTYFTVRTRDNATARLLVQDNDQPAVTSGRTIRLDAGTRSFIVPEIVSRTTSGGVPLVSRVRLTNIGGDAVQTELIFTPSGADGFDSTAVKRSVVVVPPNDVVTLTDPLVQLFRLAPPLAGQLEVRVPRERLGLIGVTSSAVVLGGSGGFAMPTANRGDGARAGAPHVLLGISKSATATTSLILAETSGIDKATIRAVLFDGTGKRLGDAPYDLPRYGYRRIDDIAAALGANAIDNGRIELTAEAGGGSVIALGEVGPASRDTGATFISRPITESVAGSALSVAFWRRTSNDTVSVATVVPVIGTPASAGAAPAYRTSLGLFASPGLAATFTAIFHGASGGAGTVTKTVQVPSGGTQIYNDLVVDLFGLPAGTLGSAFINATTGGKVYAVLQGALSGTPAIPSGVLPLTTTLSEALTSAASSGQRPLFLDGLEQSTDATRGARWMLLLNETAGATGAVNVRLYEAGNRQSPIAEKDMLIAPFQQMTLDTIFSILGLDAPDRRKDRTNVQCVVTAIGGNARIAATAVSIDNQSGDTKLYPLVPSVGSATPSISLVTPVLPTLQPGTGRRRTVKH